MPVNAPKCEDSAGDLAAEISKLDTRPAMCHLLAAAPDQTRSSFANMQATMQMLPAAPARSCRLSSKSGLGSALRAARPVHSRGQAIAPRAAQEPPKTVRWSLRRRDFDTMVPLMAVRTHSLWVSRLASCSTATAHDLVYQDKLLLPVAGGSYAEAL